MAFKKAFPIVVIREPELYSSTMARVCTVVSELRRTVEAEVSQFLGIHRRAIGGVGAAGDDGGHGDAAANTNTAKAFVAVLQRLLEVEKWIGAYDPAVLATSISDICTRLEESANRIIDAFEENLRELRLDVDQLQQLAHNLRSIEDFEPLKVLLPRLQSNQAGLKETYAKLSVWLGKCTEFCYKDMEDRSKPEKIDAPCIEETLGFLDDCIRAKFNMSFTSEVKTKRRELVTLIDSYRDVTFSALDDILSSVYKNVWFAQLLRLVVRVHT